MSRILPVLFALVLIASARPALAQGTYPAGDVFAGYSLLPANGDDFPRQTSHGFQVSVAGNLTRWFGVVGDFGMQFNRTRDLGPGFAGLEARSTVREYLVGPRFTGRSETVDVFAHALIGSATGDAGPGFEGFSDSGLAFGGGGGVDIHANERLSVRAQFELLGSFADIVDVNPRFAAGVVWRLGRR